MDSPEFDLNPEYRGKPRSYEDTQRIESAIKFLQGHGYEVFQKSAQVHAAVTSSVDSFQYASYNEHDHRGFTDYQKRDMASKLGDLLLKEGHLTLEVLPPRTDGDRPSYAYTTRTELRLSLRYWNDNRKEFRR